jgi:hypothetical protein
MEEAILHDRWSGVGFRGSVEGVNSSSPKGVNLKRSLEGSGD